MPVIGALPVRVVMNFVCTQGVTQDGQPFMAVGSERVHQIPNAPAETISKPALEEFHLACYRADHILNFGTDPFLQVVRGQDPPDFVATTESGLRKIDCAALADEHRRTGHALMRRLAARLAEGAGGRDFSGLAGCALQVWFSPALKSLPPTQRDQSLIEPLLDLMEQTKLDHAAIDRFVEDALTNKGLPQHLPAALCAASVSTPDSMAGFVANRVARDGEALPGQLGFAMELSKHAEFTVESAWSEVQRIVEKHDKPEIEELILTAGGPDKDGFCYPSEEALAHFLAEHPRGPLSASYLRSVRCHVWKDRRILNFPVDA